MQLEELKNSMSTLEQVLAKTNAEIKINVSTSRTAKVRILKKFRQGIISCAILAAVFAAAAIGNVNPASFPFGLKIYISVVLSIGAVWYSLMYRKLNRIDIAALSPAQLFSKTASLKIMVLSGEVFFGICLAVLFTLLFPTAWAYNRASFWTMSVALLCALIFSVLYYWPRYIRLFRDLNSIEE